MLGDWSEATERQWYTALWLKKRGLTPSAATSLKKIKCYFILSQQINTSFTVWTREQHPYLQDALLTINVLLFDI